MKHRGYKIKVDYDEEPLNPRVEYDNLGKMVCFHKRYDLGDSHNIPSDEFTSWGEVEKHLQKTKKIAVILLIYLYDHSGITISTKPFSCPWDSGKVGFIYVENKTIRKEYGKLTEENIKTATRVLEGEVKEYDKYLRGECYYFFEVIGPDGENVETVGGFWNEEEALSEAKAVVDADIENKNEGQTFLPETEDLKEKYAGATGG